MICRVDDTVSRGRAVSLPECSPEQILAAINEESADASDSVPEIVIDCPIPQPIHDHLGYIHPEMGLRTRTALAAAGRSRGLETVHDEEIATVRTELDAISVPEPESQQTDRTANEAETASLREDVAAARGRVQACRDHGLDPSEAERALEAAIRRLSEHRTETTAVRQQRERRRVRIREHRDRRERKFRLEDRLANLERDARRSLVDRLREEFAAAVAAVQQGAMPPPEDPFETPPPDAALAIAQVAAIDAPVVLSVDRFDSPTAAADVLGAPVIQI